MLTPRNVTAGLREAGTICAHCNRELNLGEPTSICRNCGAVHHQACWNLCGHCAAYDCAGSASAEPIAAGQVISVSREELAAATPLPSPPLRDAASSEELLRQSKLRRWNKVAVAAFVIAILGIPLFGIVTGLIALVVGCVALVGHSSRHKGFGLAVAGIVLGVVDVVGWSAGLYWYFDGPSHRVLLDQLTIDPESLNALPERIARAMRANVVVESGAGLRQGIGSGVILKVRDGLAHIVTNRHMVDFSYADPSAGKITTPNLDELKDVRVTTVGQETAKARVVWIAPHGVDLAILLAPVVPSSVAEARWNGDATPHVGDKVFAVGNPQGFGWTHSAGDISQLRRQTYDNYSFQLLQTTAAINPGNSGGGLYDAEGRLIGINTMTADKRVAEGLSFSIALPTLLDLLPETINVPRTNLDGDPP